MDAKNERRGGNAKDVGASWEDDEHDIDEYELWKGQGHYIPQRMYRVFDKSRKELHDANMRKREAKRLGEGHVTEEIIEACKRADDINEGLEILCFIRRDRVAEYRRERTRELEDIRRRLVAVRARTTPGEWRDAHREEVADEEVTKHMWARGAIRIGTDIYLHAAMELET